MSEPTALDILIAARAKIARPEDWGKGRRHFDRPRETCCLAEAYEEVASLSDERKRVSRAVHNAAGLEYEWGALTGWNDAPERTHDDVIRVLNLAIATLSLGSPVPWRTTGSSTAYAEQNAALEPALRGAES